ncbi:MAG: hypothetical protein A2W31_01790 [Planctomycetes bacterium RBG_16_64_10]|nr:MAG: hypothetical protein A2W31_01790 [Planctomycetes bacterium RBG_16_64_10]
MAKPPAFFYFDLGNVLLDFDHRRAAQHMAAVAQVPPETVWQAVFASPLQTQYELGVIDDRQFYHAFCQTTGSHPAFEALQEASCLAFDCNAAMLPLVVQLGAAGHRLGILSNTNANHWRYCTDRFGIIPEEFEQTVLSYQVHTLKPAAEIYRIAAERAGVAPAEIFFVDDLLDNVAGACRAGFDAIQYTSAVDVGRHLLRRGVRCNY